MSPQAGLDFNTKSGKITADKPATDDADFMKVLNNSNQDTKLEREAKMNGDLSGAKNYDEFLKKLEDNTKKERVPKNKLEKDDFLKLFVTQLKHQDPLSPNDSTEMASKLAQFNSLEQMLNVNKTLTKMLDSQKETRSVDMVNYVGKEININGGRLSVKSGEATEGVYKLKRPAAGTRVEIRDSSGTVVMNKELGSIESGEYKFKWDGQATDGKKVPNGTYTFSIIAQDIDERDIPVELSSRTKISGVDVQDKDGALFTGLGKVKLSDIMSIGSEGFLIDDQKSKMKTIQANASKVKEIDSAQGDKARANTDLSRANITTPSVTPTQLPAQANAAVVSDKPVTEPPKGPVANIDPETSSVPLQPSANKS